MGMIRVVRCTNAERIAYGGIEAGRIFFCTDTDKIWMGTAGGDLEFGAVNFLSLTDTPATYVGQSLKIVRVNAGETALEFMTHVSGNWTPAITFGGLAVGVTYNAATTLGRYVRFGDWVIVTGRLVLTSKGASVGNALITPLPFTCKNYEGSWAEASVGLNKITFANQWTSFVAPNEANLYLQEQTEAGVQTPLTNTNFANDSVLRLNVTYEIEP